MIKASYPSPEPQAVAGNTGPFYSTTTQDPHLSTRDARALQLNNVDPAIAAARTNGEGHGQFGYDSSAPGTLSDSRLEQQIEHNASDVRNADSTLSAKLQEALTPDMSKRKQAKASQACDDCRRKKIKCDATFATMQANEPCSSCRKLNIYCQFSRQPLKRGPDKGYIKELEEKINVLERRVSSLGSHSRHESHRRGIEEEEDFNPQQNTDNALKRKLLSSGTDAESSITAHSRPEAQRTFEQSSASQVLEVVPPSAAVMARSNNSRDDSDVLHEHEHATMGQGDQDPRGAAAQVINEKVSSALGVQHASDPPLDEYYRLVHQALPILPHTEARLDTRLSECSSKLRTAFRACLTAFASTAPSSSRLPRVTDPSLAFKGASSLILADDFADDYTSTASLTPTLVQIQALLLMAIASASSSQDQALHLSCAATLAERHDLHAPVPRSNLSTSDPDSDAHLSRRLYWILFILTRLHAVTTARSPLLPNSTTSSTHSKLQLEDQIILGEETYHFVRCAHIIEHVVLLLPDKEATVPQSSPGAQAFKMILMGELERFRESVESVLLGAPNLLHLCYWYIRMLITCATFPDSRRELVEAALKTAEIMSSKFVTVSPLHAYFRAMAHVILRQSLDDEDVRENAKAGLRLLNGGVENGGSSVEISTELVANVARNWTVAQGQ